MITELATRVTSISVPSPTSTAPITNNGESGAASNTASRGEQRYDRQADDKTGDRPRLVRARLHTAIALIPAKPGPDSSLP